VVRAKSKIRAAPLTRRGLFLLALYDSPEGERLRPVDQPRELFGDHP
jgi:hypothetical protein